MGRATGDDGHRRPTGLRRARRTGTATIDYGTVKTEVANRFFTVWWPSEGGNLEDAALSFCSSLDRREISALAIAGLMAEQDKGKMYSQGQPR